MQVLPCYDKIFQRASTKEIAQIFENMDSTLLNFFLSFQKLSPFLVKENETVRQTPLCFGL